MGPGHVFEEQYRIIEEIGRGSFGVVYRVEDTKTQQTLALKILLPWAENDRTARKRFEREAKYGKRLKHPCTVQIERFGATTDGRPYLLMELVRGQGLTKVLQEQNLIRHFLY